MKWIESIVVFLLAGLFVSASGFFFAFGVLLAMKLAGIY